MEEENNTNSTIGIGVKWSLITMVSINYHGGNSNIYNTHNELLNS